MDLWQLHIFCKVVELASFSKAGQAIHLSQPTISSHVKALEQHFGCPLIDRLSKGAVPTKAGELLYGHARRLLAKRDEIEAVMAEYLGRYRGRLVVGGSTIPGGYLLPKLIGGFNHDYPGICISLQIGDSTDIVQMTLAGTIELGFVGARFNTPHLRETILASDTLKLIVPAQHAWAHRPSTPIDQLRREPMIIREAGSGTLQAIKTALAVKGYTLSEQFHIIAEIGNTAGIIGGIKSGLGVSILSTRAIEDDLDAGRLKALAIEDLDLRRYIYLAEDGRRTLSPLAKAFRHYVLKHAKDVT